MSIRLLYTVSLLDEIPCSRRATWRVSGTQPHRNPWLANLIRFWGRLRRDDNAHGLSGRAVSTTQNHAVLSTTGRTSHMYDVRGEPPRAMSHSRQVERIPRRDVCMDIDETLTNRDLHFNLTMTHRYARPLLI